jgi:ribose transport system ATP-binding protein
LAGRPGGEVIEAPGTVLEFQGISKRFGGTLAVDNVNLTLESGTVLALLGENGAGKSTLIKLLAGVHRPDAGEIRFGKARLDEAARARIAFIHQDLGLIDTMTVSENFALVRGYPRSRGLISWRAVEAAAVDALRIVGGDLDPHAIVGSLSRTEKSILAIARALAVQADVIVLDEPSASLPEADVERLFAVLRKLRKRGVAMIYVTHRIDEVFRIADRVAVMRDGRLVGLRTVHETNSAELILLIVGRPPSEVFIQPPHPSAAPLLRLEGIRVGAVGPVSMAVMAGELVGFAGLRGAGHELLGRALGGIRPFTDGQALFRGVPLAPTSPAEAIHAGIAFVTSNRQEESLAMSLTVRENLFLNPAVRGRGLLAPMLPRTERGQAMGLIDRFNIRPRETDKVVGTLSGGNQQKAVLARWLGTNSRLLVLEEPTMGVDVGAKAEIYALIDQALRAGLGMIILSSDFEEVAHICNRAFVFDRGRVVAEVPRSQLSVASLIDAASGGRRGLPQAVGGIT